MALPAERYGEALGLPARFLRKTFSTPILTVIAVSINAAIAFVVPWHMDEFVMYRAYLCWSPIQQLNTFGESCDSYATSLAGIDFHRSYTYIGVTSSLLIAPLAKLLPFIWMPAVLGIGFVVLGALGIQRGFQLSPKVIPALMLVFPIAFAVIRDSGPVRISFLVVCWSPVLISAFLRTRHWRWVLLLAVSWAVAAEDKPFFLYLIPGIAVFCVAALAHREMTPKSAGTWLRFVAAIGISTAVAVGLLAILRVSSGPYLLFLMNETPGQDPSTRAPGALSGLFLLSDWAFSGHRISYNTLNNVAGNTLLDGILNRLPDLRSPRWIAASFFTAVSILAPLALLILAIRSRQRLGTGVLLCLLASLLLFIGAVIPGGWALHHFVFAQVPLAVAGALLLKRKDVQKALATLIIGSVAAILAILAVPPQPYASSDAAEAVTTALGQAGEDSIINCADWGCYFPGSFAARDRTPVVYANTPEAVAVLEDVARQDKSSVIHVCVFCDKRSVMSEYVASTISEVYEGDSGWRVYRVTPRAEQDQ